MSYLKYLNYYEQEWARIRDLSTMQPLPEYQQHSMPRNRTLFSLWNITFDQVYKQHSGAARLLKFLSHFDNERIWYDLLRAGVQKDDVSWFADVVHDEMSLEDALQTLTDYSLVEVDEQRGSFGLHACVHDWVSGEKNHLPDPELCWRAVACVARTIDALAPIDAYQATPLAYEVIAHAKHVTQQKYRNALATGIGVDDRAEMLLTIATHLGNLFRAHSAESLLRFILKRCETDAMNAVIVLECMGALGEYLMNLHKLEEAESFLSTALSSWTSLIHDEDEFGCLLACRLGDVLVSRHNAKDAVPHFERALKYVASDRERVLQHNASDQLLLRLANRGLARAHRQLGDADQAVALQEEAYDICVRMHGKDHGETLHEAEFLGKTLQLAGRRKEAKDIVVRNLTAKKARYPNRPTYWEPDLILLGELQATEDDVNAAVDTFEQLLAIGGSEIRKDCKFFSLMRSIGNAYGSSGNLDEATKWLEQAVRGNAAILGPCHPTSLLFKSDYAKVRSLQGHHEEAVAELRSVMTVCEQTLDPADTIRINSTLRLAQALEEKEQFAEAHTIVQEALDAAKASTQKSFAKDISGLEKCSHRLWSHFLLQNTGLVFDSTK